MINSESGMEERQRRGRDRAVVPEIKEEKLSLAPTIPAETRPEIRFAPDQRLNVAYNPNCTHEADAREAFVQEVLHRSETGGRAFCPRCDQQAMRFVQVKTAFGLYGIGACERCGYWYLM